MTDEKHARQKAYERSEKLSRPNAVSQRCFEKGWNAAIRWMKETETKSDVRMLRWGDGFSMEQRLEVSFWSLDYRNNPYDLVDWLEQEDADEIAHELREHPDRFSVHITRKVKQ